MMTNQKIIAANWKMNIPQHGISDFFSQLSSLQQCRQRVIVAPPHPYLKDALTFSKDIGVSVFAQNVHDKPNGAYTGEVSASMLAQIKVCGSIIGHSERRQYFGETDAWIRSKLIAALDAGLEVILCIGETLEQRQNHVTEQVLLAQLTQAFNGISCYDKIIVAYEPVWAIGTGVAAEPQQIQETHGFLAREILKLAGQKLPLLYGGSVKGGNAQEILSIDHVDGALVGGASLEPQEFKKIVMALG